MLKEKRNIELHFPGLVFAVEVESREFFFAIQEHFATQLAGPEDRYSERTVALRVSQEELGTITAGKKKKGKVYYVDDHRVCFDNSAITAVFDLRSGSVAVVSYSGQRPFVFCALLEQVIRFAFACHVVWRGGILLHSASVLEGHQVYLFPGHSGEGKTTLSVISKGQGRAVVCDDMNVLWNRDGRWWVEGFPRFGAVAENYSVMPARPLAGVAVLKHGQKKNWGRVKSSVVVKKLLSCSAYVNTLDNYVAEMLGRYSLLMESAETWEVTFSKAGPVWPVG